MDRLSPNGKLVIGRSKASHRALRQTSGYVDPGTFRDSPERKPRRGKSKMAANRRRKAAAKRAAERQGA